MNKLQALGLSALSGILLGVSWPETGGLSWLSFIALVPLLFIENANKGEKKLRVFWYAYLAFFIFNLWTTWWIYFASDWGMAMAIVCNALFMATVFYLFHLTKRVLGAQRGYVALILFWIGFEWLHLNWNLSWPWLTIGNVFANDTYAIQWYEYTGVLGGSLWVLIVNILIYRLIYKISAEGRGLKPYLANLVLIVGLLLFPVMSSLGIQSNFKSEGLDARCVVLQPNIDPYNEKFETSGLEQLKKMLSMADEHVTLETDFLFGPETALPTGLWEDQLHDHPEILLLKAFQRKYPRLRIIFGLSSYKMYKHASARPTATARQLNNTTGFYDAYNTSMQIDGSDSIPLYHKSKLVIGVEKMPFDFLETLSINLGGTVGSLGVDPEAKVFTRMADQGSDVVVGTAICYESVYGEYFGTYVEKGAELMSIITNDGWWEDTPGYKQHLAYARLRAIETRRPIARSANTGISAFINATGQVSDATEWWEPDVIESVAKTNSNITFYVKHGDFIGRILGALAVLMLFYMIVAGIRQRANPPLNRPQ